MLRHAVLPWENFILVARCFGVAGCLLTARYSFTGILFDLARLRDLGGSLLMARSHCPVVRWSWTRFITLGA